MKRRSASEFKVSSARRTREKRERHAAILQAAESVFAAQGFPAASIEQIAARAEYAAGTVYLYFRDKEALYLELFEGKIRELSGLIRRRIKNIKDPAQAIRELIRARMEYFERNRSFFQIFAREGMDCYPGRQTRWAGVMRLYAEYLGLLARLIGAAQRRKLLRRGDPHQFAVALSGMMMQLTRDRLRSRAKAPLQELAPVVLELFFEGTRYEGKKRS